MANQNLHDISSSLYMEARCSIEEQLELYYLVEYFIEALILKNTQGALALEELSPPPPVYLETLQMLILDGRSPDVIEEISYHFAASKDPGKPLFQALLIHIGMKCMFLKVSIDECRKILHSLFSPELQDPTIARNRWITYMKKA